MRATPIAFSRVVLKKKLFFLAWLLLFHMDMTATAALMRIAAATERSFLCSDGVKLAAQHWNGTITSTPTARNKRILCLHGWLDNCRSFHRLAPSLLDTDTELVAIDFPGHGLSSHKSPDAPPTVMSNAAFYVAETVRQLEWDSFVLIGHSMGAAVSLIYAAAFPEQISRLVLLEGAGPLTRNGRDVAKHVRASIERRQAGNPFLYSQFNTASITTTTKAPRVYPNIDSAVETRCKTATLSPGNQYLSKEASLEMVQRATITVNGGGVQFRHDPRLQWPSLLYMTDEQVEGLYSDIQCPVCLLLAEDGWPMDKTRKEVTMSRLQPVVFKTLAGSHHFHADPETADVVAEQVKAFLQQTHE
jgi:pimeloyl-ACP methyl ester carboxylesterase